MSSALIAAIARHDLGQTVSLLGRGDDPNAPDESGWRPLHYAIGEVASGGSVELVELLLKHGADVNAPLRRVLGSPWNVYDDDTPILRACDPPQLEVARMLLEAGADANAVRSDGESPLRLCVRFQDIETAALLLRHGAGETINEYGGGEGAAVTALAYAASDFNVPMIELLLREGADPETREEFGDFARDHLPPREEHDPQVWDRVMEMLGRRRN